MSRISTLFQCVKCLPSYFVSMCEMFTSFQCAESPLHHRWIGRDSKSCRTEDQTGQQLPIEVNDKLDNKKFNLKLLEVDVQNISL